MSYSVPLRVSVAGNVNSGKSSFLGILKSNEFDDGNGKSRQCIFNYPHEAKSGRTSSVANRTIKVKDSSIQFFDLPGHEKYLRTTLFGMSSTYPDIALILVEANRGIQRMTKEHIITAIYLRIPMVIVVTKIDIAEPTKLKTNLRGIKVMLKRVGRTVFDVRNESDITFCLNSLSEKFVPLFKISNVKGNEIDPPFSYLVDFLAALDNKKEAREINQDEDSIFVIDKSFKADGFPLIGSGYMRSGQLEIGDKKKLYMGPVTGKFIEISLRSLHDDDRNKVSFLRNDEMGCVAIKVKNDEIKNKRQIRAGMIITTNNDLPFTKRFMGIVTIFTHHSTTLKRGCNTVLHCGAIKQPVIIESMTDSKNKKLNCIRGGDANIMVRFRFMRGRYFIMRKDRFIFREGNTRGSGIITELL